MISRAQTATKGNRQTVSIETPEHVELQMELAGIGRRFLAYFVDKLVQFGFILTLFFIVVLLAYVTGRSLQGWEYLTKLRSVLGQWVLALAFLAYGVIFIGYFILFEYLWSGSTPGKRWQDIRVIRKDGRPITFLDSIVRNVLRFVDLLAEVYPIGLIVMFLDSRNRRLGDMVAGTLVIAQAQALRPVALESSNECDQFDAETRQAASQMKPEDYQLVSRFLGRRQGLDPEPRADLARDIYFRVFKKAFTSAAGVADPEIALERIVACYTDRTRIL
jgi:uncharacterized RDD family membrane protein YckC